MLQYLKERSIRIPFAEQVCREVHFQFRGKPYFNIGFANDLGGYELRNGYFQGGLSPKTITTIKNGKDTCCIFEGFMDYLSYLTLKEKHHPGNPNIAKERDHIILNSVVNLSKALDVIESYRAAYCFLDNDWAGIHAWLAISDRCGVKASDQSVHYRGYRDYLCGRKVEQTQPKKRGMRL